MPLSVKLAAALHALGIDPDSVEWDHFPSIAMRPMNEDGTDTVPPQLDPRFIVPLSRENHKLKTFGSHVPLSGDVSRIAKTKRIAAAYETLRNTLASKGTEDAQPKRSKWPKRPFGGRKRPA